MNDISLNRREPNWDKYIGSFPKIMRNLFIDGYIFSPSVSKESNLVGDFIR
jgi:hypothetical protein